MRSSPVVRADSRWFPLMAGAACMASLPGLAPLKQGVIRGSDYAMFYVPYYSFARQQILSGEMPLWLPYLSCGTPLHAGQQAALCYPLLTPLVLLFGANSGIKLALSLHLTICFFGAYLLSRSLQISRPAASFAAIGVAYGPFIMDHWGAGHITLVFDYALTPWFFWCLLGLMRQPGPPFCLGLAATVSLMELGGHPQVLYYALVAGTGWVVGSFAIGTAAARRAAFIRYLAAAIALTLLITAVQWLPALELAREAAPTSARGTGENAAIFAMDGGDLLRSFIPRLNGDEQLDIEPFLRGRYEHERGAYLGWLTLPLAAFGLMRARVARWQWGAAWLCVVAAEIAQGADSPFWEAFGATVPGLFWFRCHGRIFSIVTILAALLAARGLDSLALGEPRVAGRRWLSRLAFALSAAVVWTSGVWRIIDEVDLHRYWNYASQHLRYEYLDLAMLIVVTAAVLALVRYCGPAYPGFAYAAAVFLLFSDLREHNVSHVQLSPERQPPEAPPGSSERFTYVGQYLHADRYSLQFSRAVPLAIATRRSTISTNDGGLLPAAVEQLYCAVELNPGVAFRLAACSWVFVESSQTWRAVPESLPRFRFVRGATALCERPIGECGEEEVRALRAALGGEVTVRREQRRHIEVDVDAPEDGMFVLADTYYPGWRSTVDGEERTIVAAHGVFRGVRLRAGKHRVSFCYDPWSFKLACLFSACGIIAAIRFACIGRFVRRLTVQHTADAPVGIA